MVEKKLSVKNDIEHQNKLKALGEFLSKARIERGVSMRWIARKSRELYPTQKSKQISDTYLAGIEKNLHGRAITPTKLRTICKILKINYEQALEIGGYLDEKMKYSPAEIMNMFLKLSPKEKMQFASELLEAMEIDNNQYPMSDK